MITFADLLGSNYIGPGAQPPPAPAPVPTTPTDIRTLPQAVSYLQAQPAPTPAPTPAPAPVVATPVATTAVAQPAVGSAGTSTPTAIQSFSAGETYLRDNPDVMAWAQESAQASGAQQGSDYRDALNQLASQHYADYGQGEGRQWGANAVASSMPAGGTYWQYDASGGYQPDRPGFTQSQGGESLFQSAFGFTPAQQETFQKNYNLQNGGQQAYQDFQATGSPTMTNDIRQWMEQNPNAATQMAYDLRDTYSRDSAVANRDNRWLDAASNVLGQGTADTVAGNLTALLASDSPYLQQAETRALQSMNARGLLNSSMATEAAELARIQAALPIAQQDAGYFQQQGLLGLGNEFDTAMSLLNQRNALEQAGVKAGLTSDQSYQDFLESLAASDLDYREAMQLANREIEQQSKTLLSNQIDSVMRTYAGLWDTVFQNQAMDAGTRERYFTDVANFRTAMTNIANQISGANLSWGV